MKKWIEERVKVLGRFSEQRDFMKSKFDQLAGIESDERQRVEQPPLEIPFDPNSTRIDLPAVSQGVVVKKDVFACLKERRSLRKYGEEALSLDQLSFLLWATQGVDQVVGRNKKATFRPVASAGARHPFETYLYVHRVEGIEKGLYRYLPLEHQLLLMREGDFTQELVEAAQGQRFIANAGVVFLWSVLPYRTEWRYDIAAHKVLLIDAGHVCQNLYIACEAIGYGTCAVADFIQDKLDRFIQVDGEEEFALYLAPVGKK